MFARAGIVKRVCLGDDAILNRAQRIALGDLMDEIDKFQPIIAPMQRSRKSSIRSPPPDAGAAIVGVV
jgi:hypothetical protein